ncbi:hypothetical protein ABT294_13785 [Nonomuraea sp. NPDC000554]|uniref:NACHT domain-containing protein n=1 Tax=Nonomuraea sp. NPDC000554 TaxID=3154259 RepID=UPI003329DBF3
MTETLSYADALKILGCQESRLVKIVDFAATVALTGWALAGGADVALGVSDLKNDVVRYGQDVVRRAAEWRSGGNRFTRTQRLSAAHAVIVVASYFEALGDAKLPFTLEQLDMDRADQIAQAAGWPPGEKFVELVDRLLMTRLPVPEPHRPHAETREAVERVYRQMSAAMETYVRGLALWDELSVDEQLLLPRMLGDEPPAHALRIYDENYRFLAVDSPEFGVWSLAAETQALGAGLSRAARLLAELAPPRVGDRPMIHLVRMAATALDQPLMAGGRAPEDVTLPLLGEGYISPRCRVAEMTRDATPAVKSWWSDQRELPDTEAFLVGHLTSLHATQAPLVVLGEPGSGKSKLTEVLAARLAGSEFLPIRVELRDVVADSTVTSQIEQGIHALLDEDVKYQDLVDAGDGALPVVMLDGLDELLQAANAGRYDYLEQVREFQGRQARKGRPVVVIVTSRTVVADRVRFPPGVLAVQLQPFEEDQVRQWLDIWDRSNRAQLARHGRKPLPAEVALAQGELARQPLLLLLLALYDAAGNALQRDGAPLGRAQLYESLISDFAAREVAKTPGVPALPAERRRRLVEKELVRLGAVALAMFARGRPVVTETALNRDLPALCGDGRVQDPDNPVNWAQRAIGRFFFVHTNEARPADHRVRSYEFLHATFGEFLVAWLAVYAVRELVRKHDLDDDEPAALDDDLLYAVSSFSCFAERGPTVGFTRDLLHALPDETRARLVTLLGELLRESLHERRRRLHTDFAPVRHPVPRRLAAYSANLLLLVAGASQGPVSVAELLKDAEFRTWQSFAYLWRSQLGVEGWEGLVTGLPACRVAEGGERDILLGGQAESWDFPIGDWWPGVREMDRRAVPFNGWYLVTRPYLLDLGNDLLTSSSPPAPGRVPYHAAVLRGSGQVIGTTRLFDELLLGDGEDAEDRVQLYLDAVESAALSRSHRALALIAYALRADGAALPFAERGRILSELLKAGADQALLRPLLESMIAERFESWQSLVQAGIPEEVLREIRAP